MWWSRHTDWFSMAPARQLISQLIRISLTLLRSRRFDLCVTIRLRERLRLLNRMPSSFTISLLTFLWRRHFLILLMEASIPITISRSFVLDGILTTLVAPALELLLRFRFRHSTSSILRMAKQIHKRSLQSYISFKLSLTPSGVAKQDPKRGRIESGLPRGRKPQSAKRLSSTMPAFTPAVAPLGHADHEVNRTTPTHTRRGGGGSKPRFWKIVAPTYNGRHTHSTTPPSITGGSHTYPCPLRSNLTNGGFRRHTKCPTELQHGA